MFVGEVLLWDFVVLVGVLVIFFFFGGLLVLKNKVVGVI